MNSRGFVGRGEIWVCKKEIGTYKKQTMQQAHNKKGENQNKTKNNKFACLIKKEFTEYNFKSNKKSKNIKSFYCPSLVIFMFFFLKDVDN